jgi:putative ABC transport system permease protein
MRRVNERPINSKMLFLKLLKESFLFANDSLRQNKLRTFLSVLGVTIGIFMIILVFSAVDSLRANLQKSVDKLGNNSIYIQKWPWVGGDDFPWWKYMQRPDPKLREYDEVVRRSQTAMAVSYEISIDNRTVKYQDHTVEGAEIGAVSQDHNKTWNFDMSQGRYFSEMESYSGSPVAITGFDIAENLFPNGDAIGKQVKILGRYVTIVGVIKKEGNDMLGNSDDKQILLPINFAKNVLDVQNGNYNPVIVVRGRDGLSDVQVEDEMRGIMRSIRRLKPGQDDNFELNKLTIISNQMDVVFGFMHTVGMIIGLFSVAVGGFGIANIMFVSVRERTNIIGIQKSLGAKNYFILLQFLIEAIFLCIMGGVVGLILVYGATAGITAATGFIMTLDVKNIIIGIGTSVTIGMAAGIIPAYSAAKMDPVEAIRTT